MIDVESRVFDRVATAVRAAYPDIYMTGEYVAAPSEFPCVSLVEMDNTSYINTETADCSENHASVMYELNVHSNKTAGKKSECKAIAALVDEQMMAMGFNRTMLKPIPNTADATVYRMTGRYTAVVSKDFIFYRR